MKYFKIIGLFLLKGSVILPAALVFLLTVMFIGISNLVKLIYSDEEVPFRFIIEKIEMDLLDDPKVVIPEPIVEEVVKPKQVRKPRVKKVAEEVAVSEQK